MVFECRRCFRMCKGSSYCGLVGPSGDNISWMIVYASLISVEKLPLYHLCPGSLALRIVAPGAPVECNSCWWGFLSDTRSLVLKKISLKMLLSRVKLSGVEVVVIDGCEPLIGDWVYELIRGFRDAGLKIVLKTCGLLAAERYYKVKGLIDAVILEAIPTTTSDAAIVAWFYKLLPVIVGLAKLIEVHALYDGSKRAETLIADIASHMASSSAIHVIPLTEDVEDKAYRLVEKLRKRTPYVYLYGDTSYTLTHTVCPRCGNIVVKRHEWGVRVLGDSSNGWLRCPKCGEKLPVIVCHRRRRVRAIHREVVII